MNVFDNAYYQRPLLFGTNPTEELLYVIDKYNISGHALELGCGDGRDTKHVLDRGLTICAVEQSKFALETLANRNDITYEKKQNLQLIQSDVLNFSFEKSEYDFVYAITLFDHLLEHDCYNLIRNVVSSIKTGGYFFLKVHTIDDVGNTKSAEEISEFASEIKHFFKCNELLTNLLPLGRIVYYSESQEADFDHGPFHMHAFASLLLKKESIL